MLVSDASKSRESVMHTRTHEEIDHLVDGERAAAVVVEERVQRLELRSHVQVGQSPRPWARAWGAGDAERRRSGERRGLVGVDQCAYLLQV